MARHDNAGAVAVLGLAAFQILEAWNKNAPTLKALRDASPDDVGAQQQLLDAEVTVGIIVGVVAVSSVILTGDWTIAALIAAVFTAILVQWHSVRSAPNHNS